MVEYFIGKEMEFATDSVRKVKVRKDFHPFTNWLFPYFTN